MSYIKRNFQKNQVLTAADMNTMDKQIYDNSVQIESILSNVESLSENTESNASTLSEYATRFNNNEAAINTVNSKLDYSFMRGKPLHVGSILNDVMYNTTDKKYFTSQGMCIFDYQRSDGVKEKRLYQAYTTPSSASANGDTDQSGIRKCVINSDGTYTYTDIGFNEAFYDKYCHVNCLYPFNNKLYICQAKGSSKVIEVEMDLNASSDTVEYTMSYSSTDIQDTAESHSVVGICNINNKWYMFDSGTKQIYEYNTLGTDPIRVLFPIGQDGKNEISKYMNGNSACQAITSYNNKLFIMISNPNVIFVCDVTSTNGTVENVINLNGSGEYESICAYNGSLIINTVIQDYDSKPVETIFEKIPLNLSEAVDVQNFYYTRPGNRLSIYINPNSTYFEENGSSTKPFKSHEAAIRFCNAQDTKGFLLNYVFTNSTNEPYRKIAFAGFNCEVNFPNNVPTFGSIYILSSNIVFRNSKCNINELRCYNSVVSLIGDDTNNRINVDTINIQRGTFLSLSNVTNATKTTVDYTSIIRKASNTTIGNLTNNGTLLS